MMMPSELIETLLHRLSDRTSLLPPPPLNTSHHPHNTEGGGGEEEGYWLETPLIEPLSTLLLRLSGEFPLLEKFLETINIRLDVLQQETELLKEEVELGEASVHELEQQLLVEQQLMQEETTRLEGIKRDLEQENEELKSQQRITVEKLKRQLVEQAEKLEDEMTWVNEKRREAEQEVEWCQQELALAKRQVTTLQRQYLDSMKENDRLLSLKAPPSPKSLHPVLTKGLVSLSSASSIHSHFIRAPSPGLTLPDSPPPPPPFSDSSDKMSDKMSDFTQEDVPGTPNTLNPSNISSSEKVLFQHDDEDSDLTWLQTANLQLCKMIEQSNDELNRTLRHLTEWRTRCAMLTQENEEMKQKITSRMSLLTLFSPS